MTSSQPTYQKSSSSSFVSLHRKRLIIGSLLIGAALLGGTISLVWYFMDESKLLVDYSGSVGTISQPVRSGQQVGQPATVKQTVGVVQAIRNNLRVFIPAVVLILLAVTTLTVLGIALSGVDKDELLSDVAQNTTTMSSESASEDFSIMDIGVICIVAIVILLLSVFGVRKSLQGWSRLKPNKVETKDPAGKLKLGSLSPQVLEQIKLEAKSLGPMFEPLLMSRLSMNEDEKCKKSDKGIKNPLSIKVKYNKTEWPVYCPQEFSFDSIWWAFRADAINDEVVLLLNHSRAVYFGGCFKFIKMDDDFKVENSEFYKQQSCILVRIPGITKCIPILPSLDGKRDKELFEAEYENFHTYAMANGGECSIEDAKKGESLIECLIYVTDKDGKQTKHVKYVKCSSSAIIASLYKKISRNEYFGANDKIEIKYWPKNQREKLEVSKFSGSDRWGLWDMYEPMACKN